MAAALSAQPSASLSAQSVIPQQTCCAFIYSAGRWLGWAASLLHYTRLRGAPSAADDVIFQCLNSAGQNAELAYRSCSSGVPAWPDWRERQLWLAGQIAELRKPSDPVKSHSVRRQLADSAITSTYNLWAWDISWVKIDGQPFRQVNCEACYFKLGFDLAYATQSYRQADEADRGGDMQPALQQLNQARLRIQAALSVLRDFRSLQARQAAGLQCADIGLDGLEKLLQYIADRAPSLTNFREEFQVVSGASDRIGQLLQANCLGQRQQETPQRQPLPVESASASHFVGNFTAVDPTRSYAQFHTQIMLFANGTGRGKDWINNAPGSVRYPQSLDANGFAPLFWSFDTNTRVFRLDWTCNRRLAGLGVFSGIVSGNTDDFLLSGHWADGKSGSMRLQRAR